MREHRKDMIAILEITRSADGRRVPSRLALDPEFDIDGYSREIMTVFDLATRIS
jgi:hypothetical protein